MKRYLLLVSKKIIIIIKLRIFKFIIVGFKLQTLKVKNLRVCVDFPINMARMYLLFFIIITCRKISELKHQVPKLRFKI
jgi:hypothetical protein